MSQESPCWPSATREEIEYLADKDLPLAKPAEHDRQVILLRHHDTEPIGTGRSFSL